LKMDSRTVLECMLHLVVSTWLVIASVEELTYLKNSSELLAGRPGSLGFSHLLLVVVSAR
jgi:hypothetical protein